MKTWEIRYKLKPQGNKASNLILYGTRPGQVSYDGDRHGPFTKSLASNMTKGKGLLQGLTHLGTKPADFASLFGVAVYAHAWLLQLVIVLLLIPSFTAQLYYVPAQAVAREPLVVVEREDGTE